MFRVVAGTLQAARRFFGLFGGAAQRVAAETLAAVLRACEGVRSSVPSLAAKVGTRVEVNYSLGRRCASSREWKTKRQTGREERFQATTHLQRQARTYITTVGRGRSGAYIIGQPRLLLHNTHQKAAVKLSARAAAVSV